MSSAVRSRSCLSSPARCLFSLSFPSAFSSSPGSEDQFFDSVENSITHDMADIGSKFVFFMSEVLEKGKCSFSEGLQGFNGILLMASFLLCF